MQSPSILALLFASALLTACGGSGGDGRGGEDSTGDASGGTQTPTPEQGDSDGDQDGGSDPGEDNGGIPDPGPADGGSTTGDDGSDDGDGTGSGDDSNSDSGDGSDSDGADSDGTQDGGSEEGDDSAETPVIELSLAKAVSQAGYVFQPEFGEHSANARFTAVELPNWLALDANTGTLTGMAAEPGQYALELQRTDGEQKSRFKGELTVVVGEAYQGGDKIDFYQLNFDGHTRTLRNDLSGDLDAEVQFVQSHSVAPNGNYQRNEADERQSRYMPRLVAQREALLLVLPHQVSEQGVSAELLVNGELVDILNLNHPSTLPASDIAADQVAYSKQAWWARVPWQHVRNGMALNVRQGERSGSLLAADIDVGRATRLVFQTIRVGLLSEPPAADDSQFISQDPLLAAADYFQTLPVSELVMANYADVQLERVMIADGTVYDDVSADEGGVYSGDMRENVAKSQISVGINMANFGYSSHHMRQSHPHVIKQITNHHAQGRYQNGVVQHGLSGGNGIGTLYSTAGNEASHEWGHAYGIGHYPGQSLTDDGRWAVHHADSGWGFIAHRQRLRTGLTEVSADGEFSFNKDAMSGGWDASPLSRYTFYTGYSARLIQNDLERFPLADTSFASGYKQWDTSQGQFVEFNDNRPVPSQVGVNVVTIIGAYDPDGAAVIYPLLHGNHGNVFEWAEPAASGDQCWLSVHHAGGEQRIAVAAERHHADTVNQLHVNLSAAVRPTAASLNCRRAGQVTEVTRTDFSAAVPELPPLAQVGQAHGFDALRQREWQQIDQQLAALPADSVALPSELALLVQSYEQEALLAALSASSRERLAAILTLQQAASGVAQLLGYHQASNQAVELTAGHLRHHLQHTGLASQAVADVAGAVISGQGRYFAVADNANSGAAVQLPSLDDGQPHTQWLLDARGRLHPQQQPWLCLQPASGQIIVAECQLNEPAQQWHYEDEQLRNQASGQCLDYARSSQQLIPYGCHGGSNQRWQGVVASDQAWLAWLEADALQFIWQQLR